jgi:hypothetical protein
MFYKTCETTNQVVSHVYFIDYQKIEKYSI